MADTSELPQQKLQDPQPEPPPIQEKKPPDPGDSGPGGPADPGDRPGTDAPDGPPLIFFIEDPSGYSFSATAERSTLVGDVADDFCDEQGWPSRDEAGLRRRALVERVDPVDPQRTFRLALEQTLWDAGVREQDTLRIFPAPDQSPPADEGEDAAISWLPLPGVTSQVVGPSHPAEAAIRFHIGSARDDLQHQVALGEALVRDVVRGFLQSQYFFVDNQPVDLQHIIVERIPASNPGLLERLEHQRSLREAGVCDDDILLVRQLSRREAAWLELARTRELVRSIREELPEQFVFLLLPRSLYYEPWYTPVLIELLRAALRGSGCEVVVDDPDRLHEAPRQWLTQCIQRAEVIITDRSVPDNYVHDGLLIAETLNAVCPVIIIDSDASPVSIPVPLADMRRVLYSQQTRFDEQFSAALHDAVGRARAARRPSPTVAETNGAGLTVSGPLLTNPGQLGAGIDYSATSADQEARRRQEAIQRLLQQQRVRALGAGSSDRQLQAYRQLARQIDLHDGHQVSYGLRPEFARQRLASYERLYGHGAAPGALLFADDRAARAARLELYQNHRGRALERIRLLEAQCIAQPIPQALVQELLRSYQLLHRLDTAIAGLEFVEQLFDLL